MSECILDEKTRKTLIKVIDYVFENFEDTQFDLEDMVILASLSIRLERRLPLSGEMSTVEEVMLSENEKREPSWTEIILSLVLIEMVVMCAGAFVVAVVVGMCMWMF